MIFITEFRQVPAQQLDGKFRKVKFGPGHLELSHLYLLELHRATRGTFYPIFGYYPSLIPPGVDIPRDSPHSTDLSQSPYILSPLFRF